MFRHLGLDNFVSKSAMASLQRSCDDFAAVLGIELPMGC